MIRTYVAPPAVAATVTQTSLRFTASAYRVLGYFRFDSVRQRTSESKRGLKSIKGD
jgi:hypothetical protein